MPTTQSISKIYTVSLGKQNSAQAKVPCHLLVCHDLEQYCLHTQFFYIDSLQHTSSISIPRRYVILSCSSLLICQILLEEERKRKQSVRKRHNQLDNYYMNRITIFQFPSMKFENSVPMWKSLAIMMQHYCRRGRFLMKIVFIALSEIIVLLSS